jgi:hypothetical protein
MGQPFFNGVDLLLLDDYEGPAHSVEDRRAACPKARPTFPIQTKTL